MKGTLRIAIPDYAAAPNDLRMRLSFDFARQLAWTMGMYPEFVPTPFTGERAENPALPGGVFYRVLRRQADIGLTGEFYGPTRAAEEVFPGLAFSVPYYDQGPFLLVLKSSGIGSPSGLRGSRIETDGLDDRALKRLAPGVLLKRVNPQGGRGLFQAKLRDLVAGRASAVTVSSDEYLSAYGRQDLSGLRALKPTIEAQPIAVAMLKGSPLLDRVNTAIRSMKERGVLRRLQLKWHFPAVYP